MCQGGQVCTVVRVKGIMGIIVGLLYQVLKGDLDGVKRLMDRIEIASIMCQAGHKKNNN